MVKSFVEGFRSKLSKQEPFSAVELNRRAAVEIYILQGADRRAKGRINGRLIGLWKKGRVMLDFYHEEKSPVSATWDHDGLILAINLDIKHAAVCSV